MPSPTRLRVVGLCLSFCCGSLASGGQLDPRLLGSSLLGLFLAAPCTVTEHLVADQDGRVKALLVVGPRLDESIFGRTERAGRTQLLQAGLPIQTSTKPGSGLQQRVEQVMDEGTRSDQATRKVHRADEGFHRVGEDRRLVPAPVVSSPRPSRM